MNPVGGNVGEAETSRIGLLLVVIADGVDVFLDKDGGLVVGGLSDGVSVNELFELLAVDGLSVELPVGVALDGLTVDTLSVRLAADGLVDVLVVDGLSEVIPEHEISFIESVFPTTHSPVTSRRTSSDNPHRICRNVNTPLIIAQEV